MAWWGKLIGGTLGFMLGGPLGALLGASFGHNFDASPGSATSGRARERILPGGSAYQGHSGNQERVQTAFFTATFSIMGYVAKADGRVTQDEINLANALMDEMQLSEPQKKLARSLFNQGKQDNFDFNAVVDQFRHECHRRTTLLRMFLEIQVQAAFADNRLDAKENDILGMLAEKLGFSHNELSHVINMVRGSIPGQSQNGAPSIEAAYGVLGVKAEATDAEIKRAYRRLLSQHHPDKLVSKGLPEEMIKLANEKTHEIRQAWQTIQSARKSNA